MPIPRAAAYDWLASEEHLRDKSELKTLRSVHNRIKSSLILDAVTSSSARADAPLRVLDLACGRGSDLDKWTKAAVSRCAGRGGDNRATLAYVGVDISSKSVETAKKRYSGRKDARFIEGDAAMDAVARQSIDVIGIMVRARARARGCRCGPRVDPIVTRGPPARAPVKPLQPTRVPVCLCACGPLWAPVCPCVPLCAPVCPCVPVGPCVSLCVCVPVGPCGPLCVPVCPCVPVGPCGPLCVPVCPCVPVGPCVPRCARVCLWVPVCPGVSVCLWAPVGPCVSLCARVCLWVPVCPGVSVCLWAPVGPCVSGPVGPGVSVCLCAPVCAQLTRAQFAMHYFWSDEARATAIWRAIGNALVPGGIVAVIMPSAEEIVCRARSMGRALPLSNAHFSVTSLPAASAIAESRVAPFGLGYMFWLDHAVQAGSGSGGGGGGAEGAPPRGIEEFLIPWPSLLHIAATAGGCYVVPDSYARFASLPLVSAMPPDQAVVSGLYVKVLFRRAAVVL